VSRRRTYTIPAFYCTISLCECFEAVESVLTVGCKIEVSKEQSVKLDETLLNFAAACNYINQTVDPRLTNKPRIQGLVYTHIRKEYGLSANLAVRAVARVSSNRKTAKQKRKPVKEFKPTSVDYDSKIFSFREKDWTVSLTLVSGRERFKLLIGNYQLGLLKGRKPTSATLCKRKDGSYYVNIQIKDDVPDAPIRDNVIGVDFGRRDIAVTSEGDTWSGRDIQQVRDKFSRVRASVQQRASKGTRSSRRRCRQLLQRLSGREQRYQKWLNHNISKQIVQSALVKNAVLAIEDLTGIRERTNTKPRNKTERRRSNSWAFHQLRVFILYKSLRAGVWVWIIPPAYTSQTCHQCLHIGNRQGKSFKCINEACGWQGDADENGSKVIKLWGCSVNQPQGSEILSCSLSYDSSGLLKARAVA
jgi:putative transposase